MRPKGGEPTYLFHIVLVLFAGFGPGIGYQLVFDSTENVAGGLRGQHDRLHHDGWNLTHDRPDSTGVTLLVVFERRELHQIVGGFTDALRKDIDK